MNDSINYAIRVTNLSKVFKIYTKPADMFWELVTSQPRHRPFWALRDISFEVKRGQVVGIVGRNGAGKSTLLKIITGTLDKTSGEVHVNGRISSILELGTGFNGEFSGRDNVYIGGLMVGLSSKEITSKMDWIIEFSELEDFIDQPFKTYSTGMQARLTFSTAVCVDPDVLIIDEALSVGDARFQRKSFDKIAEFRRQGRTILLVSHNTNTISEFCDYAILLDEGRIFDQGEPYRIAEVYYKMLFASDSLPSKVVEEKANTIGANSNTQPESNAKALTPSVQQIPLLSSNFIQQDGYSWWVDLSKYGIEGDTSEHPERSTYNLYENDTPLKPGHWAHEYIRQYGKGAYSHWGKAFSLPTSDTSAPRTNGRTYRLKQRDIIEAAETAVTGDVVDLQKTQEQAALRARALEKLGLRQAFYQKNSHLMHMGNKKAEILDFGILDEDGKKVTRLTSGEKYDLFFKAIYYEDLPLASAGFLIRNLKGVDMFGTTLQALKLPVPSRKKGDLIEARLHVTMWLTNGIYFLTVNTAHPDAITDVQYDSWFDGYQFEILPTPGIFTSSIVDLEATLEVNCVGRFIIEN